MTNHVDPLIPKRTTCFQSHHSKTSGSMFWPSKVVGTQEHRFLIGVSDAVYVIVRAQPCVKDGGGKSWCTFVHQAILPSVEYNRHR